MDKSVTISDIFVLKPKFMGYLDRTIGRVANTIFEKKLGAGDFSKKVGGGAKIFFSRKKGRRLFSKN